MKWEKDPPTGLQYPVFPPEAAGVSQGVGQEQAVAGRGQVEDPLCDNEAHAEEQVAGRQEGDNQEHQAKGQDPVRSHTSTQTQEAESHTEITKGLFGGGGGAMT